MMFGVAAAACGIGFMAGRCSKKQQQRDLVNGHAKKTVILVDMDGVLVDWDRGFTERLKTHPRTQKLWADQQIILNRTHYEMEKSLAWAGEAPKDENGTIDFNELVQDIYCEEGFFRNLPPMEGGPQALHAMLDKGFEVFICTAPPTISHHAAQEKWEWIRQHLGDAWLNRMILTTDKTPVRGDFLIDDKPRITGRFSVPLWRQVLFDAPYNREGVGSRPVLQKWSDWEKVVQDALSANP